MMQEAKKMMSMPELREVAKHYRKKYYADVFILYEETVELWSVYEENGEKYVLFVFFRGSKGGWKGTLVIDEHGQVISRKEAERIGSIVLSHKFYFATPTPDLYLQPLCMKLKQHLVTLIIMLQEEGKKDPVITEIVKSTLNIIIEFDQFLDFLEARKAFIFKPNEPITSETYHTAKELLKYYAHSLFKMEKLYVSARKEIKGYKKKLNKMNLKNKRGALSCISKFNSGITYAKWRYHMMKYRMEIQYYKTYKDILQRDEIAQHIIKVSEEHFDKMHKKIFRN
ncbi:hypothetical protein [Bacillus arachidis]|uniref:hypothetical protein n=1 Tax=Bacillus arachidis TaxID=2819290 RepID=UPI00255CE853|nr:hypothetical protein [Bacillus arachidis]WIY62231.1 hypothetical protein QRY57_06925 [Bacillus arachidis]